MTALLRWLIPARIAPRAFDWSWHVEGVNCNSWCRVVRHNRPRYDWSAVPPYPVPGQLLPVYDPTP